VGVSVAAIGAAWLAGFCALDIFIHEDTEVQERHLALLLVLTERENMVRGPYGFPSFPKTTPFGSDFGVCSSVLTLLLLLERSFSGGGGGACASMFLEPQTAKRNCERMGTCVPVTGMLSF